MLIAGWGKAQKKTTLAECFERCIPEAQELVAHMASIDCKFRT
jgi:hypothetical protein